MWLTPKYGDVVVHMEFDCSLVTYFLGTDLEIQSE